MRVCARWSAGTRRRSRRASRAWRRRRSAWWTRCAHAAWMERLPARASRGASPRQAHALLAAPLAPGVRAHRPWPRARPPRPTLSLPVQVERAKASVDKVADKGSYLEVCTALRQQMDKEVELSQQLQVGLTQGWWLGRARAWVGGAAAPAPDAQDLSLARSRPLTRPSHRVCERCAARPAEPWCAHVCLAPWRLCPARTNLQSQKALLEKAEATHAKVASRLKELSSSYQEGSSQRLLESLSEDVKNLRFQVRRSPRTRLAASPARSAAPSPWGRSPPATPDDATAAVSTTPSPRTVCAPPLPHTHTHAPSAVVVVVVVVGCRQVNERCPKELEKRQRRATALQEAFTNGVNTEVDLQRLQAQASAHTHAMPRAAAPLLPARALWPLGSTLRRQLGWRTPGRPIANVRLVPRSNTWRGSCRAHCAPPCPCSSWCAGQHAARSDPGDHRAAGGGGQEPGGRQELHAAEAGAADGVGGEPQARRPGGQAGEAAGAPLGLGSHVLCHALCVLRYLGGVDGAQLSARSVAAFLLWAQPLQLACRGCGMVHNVREGVMVVVVVVADRAPGACTLRALRRRRRRR